MPEEQHIELELERVLDHLDEFTQNKQKYLAIQNALDSMDTITTPLAEKVLAICVRDLNEDKCTYTNNSLLKTILTILKRVKAGQCFPLPDLVPSAVAVLGVLKTTALLSKGEALKTLCLDIMEMYPDETLISLTVDQSTELMELFNLFCHQRIPLEIRLQPINLVLKILKILPPDKKATFVKKGIPVWFSKIIPTVLSIHQTPFEANMKVPLETIELLTEQLIHIDYADNPQWQTLLECIYTPQKYPTIMKELLGKGSDLWHRLWIVFIKLLKSQITKTSNSLGSPINSMLPVVEMAFKMDVTNRCRAFECWNVLIDNFSTETNEVYINKRIKLLIIPLTSNNAKVEETALAKLKTWWHLITSFYPKLDKFAEIIVIPFLHFAFGKSAPSDKLVLVPGMISEETKNKCAQAFINIVGHFECDGCVTLPKLKGKLLTAKLLVSHWKDWMNSLNHVLKQCALNLNDQSEKQIKCVWKTFIMTIGELPENNIRRDIFNEVLLVLEKLNETNDNVFDVMLNILIPTLFEENDKIRPLLKKRDEYHAPLHKILSLLIKNPFTRSDNGRHNKAIDSLKIIMSFLVEVASKTSSVTLEWILKELPTSNMLLWTALAESISELQYVSCPRMLCKLLLWPLTNMNLFLKEKRSTSAWLKTYKIVHPSLKASTVNDDIFKLLMACKNGDSSDLFILNAAIILLQKKLEQNPDVIFEKEAGFILKSLQEVIKCEQMETVLLPLIDTVKIAVNSLKKNLNLVATKHVLLIIMDILKHWSQIFEKEPLKEIELPYNIERMFECLDSIFKVKEYSNLRSLIIPHLTKYASFLKKQKSARESVLAIYESSLNNDNTQSEVTELIKAFSIESKLSVNKDILSKPEESNFTTPSNKPVTKKTKKKEANIVNTVVENGEEYVVIKSNWKFNPRKLTDNQKEKLQRKKEDIPALYQDLSQSQDEFRLSTWKTDSQDTSSKSSNLPPAEDVSSILKNIPETEFVPKILENLRKDNDDSDKGTITKENTKIDTNKIEVTTDRNKTQLIVSKDTKSPRMALKDRVFRNVRNLIEKSNLPNDAIDVSPSILENGSKTPTMTKVKPSANLINSAPSQISADRPTRVKRKPKKFADLQLFSIKKRRHSAGQTDSATDSDSMENGSQETQKSNQIIVKAVINSVPKENVENLPTTCNNVQETTIPKIETDKDMKMSCDQVNTSVQNKGDEITVENINKDIAMKPADTSILDDIKKCDDDITEKEEKVAKVIKLTETPVKNDNNDSTMSTPKNITKKGTDIPKSSNKKSTKKSRIEKELAIDMVEGHPFLTVPNTDSEKRLTRKAIANTPTTRKSLSLKNRLDIKITPKSEKKLKEKEKVSISVTETQNTNTQDIPESQDIIESSQDSTVTTISAKTSKNVANKELIISLSDAKYGSESETQELLDESCVNNDNLSKNDSELPCNKTANDNVLIDLTANMDTETMKDNLDDVIIINDDEDQPITVSTDATPVVSDTQNTAEADTEPLDPYIFAEDDNNVQIETMEAIKQSEHEDKMTDNIVDNNITNASIVVTQDDVTKTMTESLLNIDKEDASSPFKDDDQRKKDFLNNTLEISPIKTMSPEREKKSPSPETSSDYVVIKLSSPVQSNGEPFEKYGSPEIFTEDKISPDKRDQSPPREEVSTTNNTSPSSSLSLKKNRPQVRTGGRAAQMLGLCVPDRLQTIMMSEKSSDIEETKKSPSLNTSARRNLRILYNSSATDNNINDNNNLEENDDSDNFLKLQRTLPSIDCSPSGPILKRKLADITDEATVSPASKRKRVSFHDPPVSTTMIVNKYIEPSGIRSPQNSLIKRQERQRLAHTPIKSPKRLENVFKLDSVLTKTIESFSENSVPSTNEDTQTSSLDQTPIVEVIKTSDLNDCDPICPELVECKDPIANIAMELSSPVMKTLLVKEFEGKIETVGDMAKLTELEVNRLCIKAPKVEIAKKVLNNYVKNKKKVDEEITPTVEAALSESDVPEANICVEVQTNEILVENVEMQTDELEVSLVSTQTDMVLTLHSSVQTNETGSKSTADIITNCLSERSDFVEKLCQKMDEPSKEKIADNLSFNALSEMLIKKLNTSNCSDVLNRVIEQQSSLKPSNTGTVDKRLSVIQEYLCARFDSKDIVLFCSDMLRKVYEKPS